MVYRILFIIAAITLNSCEKFGEKPVGIADPSNQSISTSDDMTPIKLSTSNNIEGTTFVWSRDKLDEISGPIPEGNGQTINSVGYVMNWTDKDQLITYTIVPTGYEGKTGKAFTATINVIKTYVFTGTVIDQVTQLPVSGASVYYAYRPFNENDHFVGKIGEPVLSGQDGSFKISVPKEIYSDRIRYPGQVIYASEPNYIGSSIVSGSGIKILLYHPAELHLHVKNDTINNQIDEIGVWIIGDPGFWGYPGFIGRVFQGWLKEWSKLCAGRDFDTIFVVKKLWGNIDYEIGGGGSYPSKPLFDYSLTLKPDTITHFDVLF